MNDLYNDDYELYDDYDNQYDDYKEYDNQYDDYNTKDKIEWNVDLIVQPMEQIWIFLIVIIIVLIIVLIIIIILHFKEVKLPASSHTRTTATRRA